MVAVVNQVAMVMLDRVEALDRSVQWLQAL
jgi:hypothetical protein